MTTGKTKITSSGLFNGIFKGDFFKAQPIVSESDIAALKNYNKLLSNNKPQEAFEQAMNEASVTAQNLAKSAKGAAVDINNIPKASKAAAAGLKLLSVAGNMLLYMAIAKGIQWILTFNERLEESRQKMIEAGQEASQLTKDLDGLVEQYRKLGADGKFDNSDREQARSIQEQINALLGDEAHYIDLSNGSYKHQLELLRRLQHEQANAKYATIKDAKEAAETSLRSKISNVGVGNNIAKAEVEAVEKLSKLPEMDKYLKTYEGDENGKGKFAIFNVDTSSTEAMITSYEKMIELRNILSKSYADEIKKGGSLEDFYNNLTDEIDELSGAVQKYKDAIDDYNINEAVVQFNETDFGGVKGALINTKEEMESWVKAMLESGDISDGVKENLIGLAKTYYPDLSDAINENAQAFFKKKYAEAESSSEISKHIKNLDAEADQCGLTKKEYIELISTEILFNNNNLNITQKVSALQQLAYQAGITADKMREALMFDSLQKAYETNTYGIEAAYRAGKITKEERDARKAQVLSELNSSLYDGYEDDTDEDTPPDLPTGKSAFDDNYYSLVEAWLEDNKKEIERLKKEQEDLNRQFENVLETGNKDRVEILRTKLTENNRAQKDALHRQNNAHRATKQSLIESLYQIAPELNGKSWEEISEVDLVSIENRLSNAAEETKTSKKNNNKDKAKLQLNTFKGVVEDIKRVDNIIKENSASWWDIDENAKKYWESQIDFQEDYSRNWIENQKSFDKLTDEEELAAYGRMVNNNKEFQKKILNDTSLTEDAKLELIKSTNDKILDIEKDAYDKRKELFDEGADFGNTYLDSHKTLLQSYYDVTNSIAEAQHEINKELETSKTMYEYLDEDTRKLLFNQDDYNDLSEELLDIQYRADKLQRQYNRELNNATLDTIESITSNYQMQYETLMKSYEIAKADLEIAKKKQKLNNVLNERTVRMFINGSWQWVANTEDVANAKSELADAEYAKRVEEAGLTQQQSINNLTKQQDELGVVIKKFESGVIDLGEAIKQAEKAIGNMPNTLASIFNNAKGGTSSSYSSGSTVYGGNSGGGSNSSYISWAKSQMAENSKNWHTADENGKRALEAANQSLGNAIGSTFDSETGTWKHKYATGTKYTQSGSALMGEKGEEFYISANGRFIPITQPTIGNIPGGGVVFNREQMKNLRTMWDMSNLNFKGGSDIVSTAQPQQIDQSQDNRIIINGMTVDSGSADGQALISALRRYIGNH